MQQKLWTLNALAVELGRDRRSLARDLEGLTPNEQHAEKSGRISRKWSLARVTDYLAAGRDPRVARHRERLRKAGLLTEPRNGAPVAAPVESAPADVPPIPAAPALPIRTEHNPLRAVVELYYKSALEVAARSSLLWIESKEWSRHGIAESLAKEIAGHAYLRFALLLNSYTRTAFEKQFERVTGSSLDAYVSEEGLVVRSAWTLSEENIEVPKLIAALLPAEQRASAEVKR
jgi:hypothetical protein